MRRGNDASKNNDDDHHDVRQRSEKQQPNKRNENTRRRMHEEMRIVKDFETVFVSDIDKLNKLDVLQKEREIVWKLFRCVGVVEGTTAAVITFLGLHKFPRYLAQRATAKTNRRQNHMSYQPHYRQQQENFKRALIQKQRAQQTLQQLEQSPFRQGHQNAATAESSATAKNRMMVDTEKQVKQSRQRFLYSSMELLFDVGMSVGMGICVAMLSSDKKEFQRLFITIPMQPGNSVISDQICSNLLREYQRQWRHRRRHHTNHNTTTTNNKIQQIESGRGGGGGGGGDDDYAQEEKETISRRSILMEPRHPVLHMIKSLSENCRHRQVMENQIRQGQQGFVLPQSTTTTTNATILAPPQAPVVPIPETGVIPMSEDPLTVMMMEEEGEGEEDNFHNINNNDSSRWEFSKKLVQDQEEHDDE